MAVRTGVIERHRPSQFGDVEELGEFLGILNMDDDAAALGLAENFSEFDSAKNDKEDGIVSREDLGASRSGVLLGVTSAADGDVLKAWHRFSWIGPTHKGRAFFQGWSGASTAFRFTPLQNRMIP